MITFKNIFVTFITIENLFLIIRSYESDSIKLSLLKNEAIIDKKIKVIRKYKNTF